MHQCVYEKCPLGCKTPKEHRARCAAKRKEAYIDDLRAKLATAEVTMGILEHTIKEQDVLITELRSDLDRANNNIRSLMTNLKKAKEIS